MLAVLAAVLIGNTAFADLFLNFDGVRGDSTREGFVGQISVDSFNFSMLTRGDFTLTLNKSLDSSSVPLQLLCANGRTTKRAVLSFTAQLADRHPLVYSVTLDDVTVVSAGMSGESSEIRESYTLKFNKVQWQYFKLDPRTGSVTSTNSAGWSIIDGKAF